MPHEDFDSEIEELVTAYEWGAKLMQTLILAASATTSTAELRSITTQIAEIFADLLAVTIGWINRNAPAIYRAGIEETLESMGERGEPAELIKTLEHRETLQTLAEDLRDDLIKATEHMGRDADRQLREIKRKRITAAMASRNPLGEVADFRQEMEERGVRFVDRSGRGWKPGRYAEMTLRTHSAEILNQGALNTAVALGSPGVAVSDGGPGDVDEPCRRANGQRWSLPYAGANLLEHPNCRRAFAPLPRSYTGELDKA